jgi:hypothetical protein
LSVPFDRLIHCFLDIVQVAFWDSQKADNTVKGCMETMKHHFIDFTQVVFCGGQKSGK